MISLDRLAKALGITDESQIPQLEDQRDQALAFIEQQTHRYFGSVTSTVEFIRGDGTRNLWLRDVGIDDAVAITVDEFSHVGATAKVITQAAADGWVLRVEDGEARLIRKGGSSAGTWTRDYEYGVTYTRGYADNEGPKDVEALLIALVRLKQSADQEGFKKETIGSYSYERFDAGDIGSLTADDQKTLASWTRIVFA